MIGQNKLDKVLEIKKQSTDKPTHVWKLFLKTAQYYFYINNWREPRYWCVIAKPWNITVLLEGFNISNIEPLTKSKKVESQKSKFEMKKKMVDWLSISFSEL